MTAPTAANAAQTRAVFDFNRTSIEAYDGDDVYIVRDMATQTQLFRTDWTLKPRVLIWSQPLAGPEITSVYAKGGKVALSLWDVARQPGGKSAPDRVDTSVVLLDRDGANPKVVTTASLLAEAYEEETYDDEPVSCGSHVEVAALADDGTLFVARTTGARISKMCNGSEHVNEYRIERLGADGALSTHYTRSEKIDIAEDPFNGDITFGGLLDMSTSSGFSVINDDDDAIFERLDATGSRTVFGSPIHRGSGFATSSVRSDGSILMNDWRIGSKGPGEKKRVFLLASPNAKPKRIAPKFTDAEGIDCGGLITVWREDDIYVTNDRVWLYSSSGDFMRIVQVPKRTIGLDCAGARLVTFQLESRRRAVLSTFTLR